jgi:CheY-like chemotaxis protein
MPMDQDIRVLLVDDHELNASIIGDYLNIAGLDVSICHNGKECLLHLEEGNLPDILLLDIQMPGMDGIEVMRIIRSHEQKDIRDLLVVALTALAMDGDAKRCLEAGANFYLSKPIKLQELLGFIISKVKELPV